MSLAVATASHLTRPQIARPAPVSPDSFWGQVGAFGGSFGLHGLLAALLFLGALQDPFSRGGGGSGSASGGGGPTGLEVVFAAPPGGGAAEATDGQARESATLASAALDPVGTLEVQTPDPLAAPTFADLPEPVLETASSSFEVPPPARRTAPAPEPAPTLLAAPPEPQLPQETLVEPLERRPTSSPSVEPPRTEDVPLAPPEDSPQADLLATLPEPARPQVAPLEPLDFAPPETMTVEPEEPAALQDAADRPVVRTALPDTPPAIDPPTEPLDLIRPADPLVPAPISLDPVVQQIARLDPMPPDSDPAAPDEIPPEVAKLAVPLPKPQRDPKLEQPQQPVAKRRAEETAKPALKAALAERPAASEPQRQTVAATPTMNPAEAAAPTDGTTGSNLAALGSGGASPGAAGTPGSGGQDSGRSTGRSAGSSGGDSVESYAGKLAALLNRHKRYPHSSRRRGEEGVVTLRFTVDPYGRVVEKRILRSSGHRRLDAEVIALLERASPLPHPPSGGARLSLAVPIVFSLR
ncbi:MAG: hypothetical protein Kilf2KO_07580 [Rhodospirillales bacterium]